MASKALNSKNLAALGAEKLAELLIEISAGNDAAKRRLRLELAGTDGTDEVAREVRKRIATIARSRSFVDWHKRRPFAEDLATQSKAIGDLVAKSDPTEALDLMWRFMDLADGVFERCDDSDGRLGRVFGEARERLAAIAQLARPDPVRLADEAFRGLTNNRYGQYDGLIGLLAPTLGSAGLEHLKQRFAALSRESVEKPAPAKRKVIGWGMGGPLYADEVEESLRKSTVRLALQEIADAQGDVDAFMVQFDERARAVPRVAAEIANRLLAAGRPEEALKTLDAAEIGRGRSPAPEWEDARIAALDALGRGDEAQAARWACFEKLLSPEHLRAYLKRLPDFDDMEAEEKALDRVEAAEPLADALAFLVVWPALDRASRMVIRRSGELDGDRYEVLSPAADALADRHPLAATLALRAMIDDSLARNRSSRFRHAARHFQQCESLAGSIPGFTPFETHEAFAARLRRDHGLKRSFWSLIP